MPVPDPRGHGRGNGAVQLVVTDLDGTLSDAAERIHPASVRAIRDLEATGIPVLVATGRRLRMACAVLEAGGLTGPAVVLDGALGLDLRDGRVFHQTAFPPAAARQVLHAFAAAGLSPCVYVDRPGVDPVVAAVGPRGSASVVADLVYGGCTVQVRPPGVSKWSGVLAYCAEQGIDPGRVLAVGDGANDLELLDGAAVACVVATAPPAVLARADHLIGPPASGGWA